MAAATAAPRGLTPVHRATRWRVALATACTLEGWMRVDGWRRDEWSVLGRRGDTYWIRRVGDTLTCTCPAGRATTPCWHVWAVVLAGIPPALRGALGPLPSPHPAHGKDAP